MHLSSYLLRRARTAEAAWLLRGYERYHDCFGLCSRYVDAFRKIFADDIRALIGS